MTKDETPADRTQASHSSDDAVARLLIMEQSLLSMRRFLSTLERDLARSLGEKPRRQKLRNRRQPTAVSDG